MPLDSMPISLAGLEIGDDYDFASDQHYPRSIARVFTGAVSRSGRRRCLSADQFDCRSDFAAVSENRPPTLPSYPWERAVHWRVENPSLKKKTAPVEAKTAPAEDKAPPSERKNHSPERKNLPPEGLSLPSKGFSFPLERRALDRERIFLDGQGFSFPREAKTLLPQA